MLVSIIIGVCIVIIGFVLVLFINAMNCKRKGRTLCQKQIVLKGKHYCERLSKMIQCKTISSLEKFDSEEFMKLRDVIKEFFPTVMRTAHIQYFGDDCYLLKIEGINQDKNVMLMSHHDVVAADGRWKYPPFSGTIADGKIWGRGTVDTKTPLFAEFTVLEELLSEGWKPSCNVYLLSSHNEETGGDGAPLAMQWMKENHLRFEWIIDEGGAVIDPPLSGLSCKCAMLAIHEKGRYKIRMKASKEKGHGSLNKNVLSPSVRMAAFITKITTKQPFIRRMYPEVQAMFESLAPHMNLGMRLIFANMWLFKNPLVKIIPALNAQAGSMLGTTCYFDKLNTTESGNVTCEVFFREVNKADLEKDLEKFFEIASAYSIVCSEVLLDESYKPADLNSPGFQYIKQCTEKSFPYAACAPFILPAGTDARHLCDLSDAVVRFAPIDIDNQQYGSVHNIDENIGIDAVAQAVDYYKELLRNYEV